MKNRGIKFGMLLAGVAMVFNTTVAMAAPSVTETKDNITVTKTAEWTKVDDKVNDGNGNPYAKVTFKVDATKADDQVVKLNTTAGHADVVIVLDNTGSMGAEFQTAKAGAIEFAEKMLDTEGFNVRVGLVAMGSTAVRAVDFTSDKKKITDVIRKLEFDPVMWGTNFQESIYEAQLMLEESQVHNKLIVFQSDGVPEACFKKDVNKSTYKTGPDIVVGTSDVDCAIKQTEVLKRKFKDVGIATIGYTHATSDHTVLKKMCTNDATGNQMFYEGRAQSQVTNVVGDLIKAFKNTENTFTQIITGNSLVDKVPSEYEIIESSLKSSDSTVKGNVNKTQNTVTFTWGQKLEKKVYEVSFIIKLKKEKVPSCYISSKKEVYTNGTTIDVTKDSSGSAILNYGLSRQISLKSPSLPLDESLFKVATGAPIVEAPKDETPKAETPTTDAGNEGTVGSDATPKTADSFKLGLVLMVGAVALAGMVVVVIRRKRMTF